MSRTERFLLPPDKRAVREARLRTRAFAKLPREEEAKAELVVSELVANSVLHARLGPDEVIEVTLRLERGLILIEVADSGGFSGRPRHKGGLGLRVLDGVCEHWHAEDGRVSASIRLAASPPAGEPGFAPPSLGVRR